MTTNAKQRWKCASAFVLCVLAASCSSKKGLESGVLLRRAQGSNPSQSGAQGSAVKVQAAVASASPGTSFSEGGSNEIRLRRLTRSELKNTWGDLLELPDVSVNDFPSDAAAGLFDNESARLVVTRQYADALQEKSNSLARAAVKNLNFRNKYGLDSCASASGEMVCVDKFIENMGRRAYRRPLSAVEIARYKNIFSTVRPGGTLDEALSFLTATMLQSPGFLYRSEIGTVVDTNPEVARLTPYELASELSYMLWNSLPDDELLNAARDGKLNTKADVEIQARRMLKDDRAKEGADHFFGQWFSLDAIDSSSKDTSEYSLFSPELKKNLKDEAVLFFREVMWEKDASLKTLLSSNSTHINARLAQYYAVKNGPSGEQLVPFELDPAQRAGFLTSGGFLLGQSTSSGSSPVQRGIFVLSRLICTSLGEIPAGIELKPSSSTVPKTGRAQFSEHSSNPACAGCHTKIDPIGFSFENYDGIGQYRTKDNGLQIDASGTLKGTDVDSPIANALELSKKLSGSGTVAKCATKHFFEYAMGRGLAPGDDAQLNKIRDKFVASNTSFLDLMIETTQADSFYFRKLTKN